MMITKMSLFQKPVRIGLTNSEIFVIVVVFVVDVDVYCNFFISHIANNWNEILFPFHRLRFK